jgi:general secretion pathway protein C
MMKRLPLLVSFVLFLALCASLTYWALQLFAPMPRAVTAPAQAARKLPSIAAAQNLFGGQAQSSAMANMQLRGVIHAGKASDSEAILVAGNEAPKYVKVDAEVTDGVTVKEIHVRHVVLDDHGVSREVNLPAFTPTPVNTPNFAPPAMPTRPNSLQPNTSQPANPAQSPAAPELPAEPPAQSTGVHASGGSAAEEESSAAAGHAPQPAKVRSATNLR